ncbi:MAG TPA: T9SS type A sorting domain-containing protein, partial [Bacteroidia bacterium]|nr:T9SS type A sorting domain-containing protein [Bacteroidia bacterium]
NEEFILYPNPVVDKFTMRLEDNIDDEILVVVSDVFGKEQFSKIIMTSATDNTIAVDLERKLPPGIYTVVATNNDKVFKKKIVVK